MTETKKQHIIFVCSRLDLPGGIERAIVNTANLLAQNGFYITLLVLDEIDQSFYKIHSSIAVRQVHLSFGIVSKGNVLTRKFSFMQDIHQLRKELLLLKPDIIVATEYPFAISIVLSGLKRKAKLLSWEHHHFYEMPKNAFWRSLFQFAYPRLDGIVCLNEDEKKLFTRYNHNVSVIPNFCAGTNVSNNQRTAVKKKFLTVGRLTHVKGTDLLLAIALQVLQQNPGWQWKLIGEGEMRGDVLQFISSHSLQSQLLLQQPVSPDIEEEYRDAAFYVMTSRNECFPMTLLEAMQQGLPCVAFDCETGPRAIIRQNENGMLVEKESIREMIRTLQTLIEDTGKRETMGAEAQRSVQRFSAEKILLLWTHLFNSL